MSWYDDMDAMADDDRWLQDIYADLRRELSDRAWRRTRDVHVYPSTKCTYTLSKRRIFVRVRGDDGARLPPCAIRHVMLHELAHVLNDGHGHDDGFRAWLRWLLGTTDARRTCAGRLPAGFNPCGSRE